MNIAVAIRLLANVGDKIEVDSSGTDIDPTRALKVAYARGADGAVLVDAGEIGPHGRARVRAGVP